MTAALLHDIGHGAYSHTFEGLFGTDHEKMTQLIITSPETEVNQIPLQAVSYTHLDVYKRQFLLYLKKTSHGD